MHISLVTEIGWRKSEKTKWNHSVFFFFFDVSRAEMENKKNSLGPFKLM